ncbi:bifunctional 4-hydroxy-2-oxoglutarate aldolase/2-dehydro-3-deoxy-phosphogluconate aldolase [Propylenella binzhouense]|uniref:2-dehydro-3-deoxy-phosphogluconate aldolase n=1 Tax=Propylenella binzhouense TaxID=2555902 RepID=A0A964T5K9_9HYPH|nr:bifunctional 4-hydroxy-2-oxoglutarate aldolase/2-dehydro-3-deoxy-phosphogluconate aldolase [Propylenella binzhouense]MYZ48946.1 bifunctional 4-hydroxy-2-oxoglutarate aldolase/2-dehydro-3-deoxy-phosphogluconate aldolase [Propylenella binzhouense]
MSQAEALAPIVGAAPVVPVVIIDDPASAVPLARALVAGGLPAIEITLRTPAALAAIEAIAAEVEGATVGAGTVLDAKQLAAAEKAGARFAVSPGASPDLLAAAGGAGIPLMPGAATASEAMSLLEKGFTILKFFPAEPAGGRAYLGALASPLPMLRFCPTGGVSAENAAAYLALPNVVCVGGSWVAPQEAIAERDWRRIERLAAAAATLRG